MRCYRPPCSALYLTLPCSALPPFALRCPRFLICAGPLAMLSISLLTLHCPAPLCFTIAFLALHCFSLSCAALTCLVLPCPVMPCPDSLLSLFYAPLPLLPCGARLFRALNCVVVRCSFLFALACFVLRYPVPPILALLCHALPCIALQKPALRWPVLIALRGLPWFTLPCTVLHIPALHCPSLSCNSPPLAWRCLA